MKRLGASQQDIDLIEEEIMFQNPNYSKKGSYAFQGYNYRNSRVSGGEDGDADSGPVLDEEEGELHTVRDSEQ